MKKLALVVTLGISLLSCKNDKKTETVTEDQKDTANVEASKSETKPTEFSWDQTPELNDIGDFPFITAPAGLKIKNEKDGLSESFDFQKMANYTGNSIFTTEGKLGIISFNGADGKDFSQVIFDKSVYAYLDKIGAKMLYKGNFPQDETQKATLEKNMWSGKYGTYGIIRESEAPFAVYAFRNNGKKYIVTVQSNSAQGNVFVMELQDFEQTIKKYSAEQMKTEIDKTGKAILNINFDTDKATLQPDGQKTVDEILALLRSDPNLKLSIEGHTDNTGTPQRNKQLSADRANTVMYALAAKGIDIKRLKASGFGSEKPLKPNDSEENKSQNRRVELVKF